MQKQLLNQKVLMSGADYFRVEELNPYSHLEIQPNKDTATKEHTRVASAISQAGVEVIKVPAPKDCQDGIYTANWGLCYQGTCILSVLPNKRRAEEAYAKAAIEAQGYKTIKPPYNYSGQGDSLICGNYLFVGSNYRTDPKMHDFIARVFDFQVIPVQTIPELDKNHRPMINHVTGWPDSYFYDIDIAIAILKPDLIAWCPEAFDKPSQDRINTLPLKKIRVSLKEAKEAFACNLVSTGETVIMSDQAPELRRSIEQAGLRVTTLRIKELSKGGGYIRCCSLTLS